MAIDVRELYEQAAREAPADTLGWLAEAGYGYQALMPKTLAAATVDRLLHHTHVLITDGSESYRLAQATAGERCSPWPLVLPGGQGGFVGA